MRLLHTVAPPAPPMCHACGRAQRTVVVASAFDEEDGWLVTRASIAVRAAPEQLYAAYVDLPRMTEWSPMLQSVTFDAATRESAWSLRVPKLLSALATTVGFPEPSVTWRAINVIEEPAALLSWRSIDGMENAGCARFAASPAAGETEMSLELYYRVPKRVRGIVRSDWCQDFVRRTMLGTMERFKGSMEEAAECVPAGRVGR